MKEFKNCPICDTLKPIEDFGKYFSKERGKYRIQNYCKDCQKVEKTRRSKEYYENNKEKRLAYCKQYRDKNKKVINKKRKKFKEKYTKELKDCYVVEQITRRLKMNSKDVREYPGLIEAYRANILLKRTIKEVKNEQ
jgi:hypothetical protein